MIYLVILFLLFDAVIIPFFISLNHYKLKIFSMIDKGQHFQVIYHTPHFLPNWLHAQLTIIPIFVVLTVIVLSQRSRLLSKSRNLSDKHGIRGSARWASRNEILKWWWK